MNYKKEILLAIGIIVSWVILDTFVLCRPIGENLICQNNFGDWAQILFLFSAVLLVFLTPLYFLKESTYRSWKKFSLWYLPIVAIPLLLSSSGSHGFNPGVGMDTESLTFFFSGLYALISFILIVYKSVRAK